MHQTRTTRRTTGRLRSRVLSPEDREVDPAVRGFAPWVEDESIVARVGGAFLTGYRAGLESRRCVDAVPVLQDQPDQWRGFALEGLGMAAGVRSALSPVNRHQLQEVLVACGERHAYMLYVGLGWALARTPRVSWPDLRRWDPLMVPLVLDGYGFHEVFFRTPRVLTDEGVVMPSAPAWPGAPELGRQHLAQGVGRGLWFVVGGSEVALADTIERAPGELRASMWSGAGLAAAYAGGRGAEGLRLLRKRASGYAPALQQGAAFAIEARRRAGTVVPHTEVAARELCDRSVEQVHDVVVAALPPGRLVDGRDWGSYESWRLDVASSVSTRPSRLVTGPDQHLQSVGS